MVGDHHGRRRRLAPTINAHGQVEWIPPPDLDTGQTRVNDYHHPERMLNPDGDDEDDGDQEAEP